MKRTIAFLLLASMMISLLSGCKSQDATNLLSNIDAGQPVKIEVRIPSTFKITYTGKQLAMYDSRKPLEKEDTYYELRQNVDTLFNINIIRDANSGNGKQGCLFVTNIDGNDVRSGSTCLADAFRNKKFMEYWGQSDVQTRLLEIGANTYSDLDVNTQLSTYAALNGYFNLIPDAVDPVSFNATQTLSREEFYSFLYRAMYGNTNIAYEPSIDLFTQAIGGNSSNDTKYAKEVEQYGWLRINNKSLDSETVYDKISRAEAIYMVIQMCFPDVYARMEDGSPSFKDAKSNGDLAMKLGFKDKETGQEKERWQAYVLAYMVRNPDKGMQSELYRATAAAKALNIIKAENCRWNESLAKFEALDIVIRALRAMNDQYGYATSTEYATIDAPVELPKPQIPENIRERILRLTDVQIGYFQEAAEMYQQEVKDNKLTEAQANQKRIEFLNDTVGGTFMMLVVDLFPYWQYANGYAETFPNMTTGPGSLAGENITDYNDSDNNEDGSEDKDDSSTNKGDSLGIGIEIGAPEGTVPDEDTKPEETESMTGNNKDDLAPIN